jgi:hypothetical protein
MQNSVPPAPCVTVAFVDAVTLRTEKTVDPQWLLAVAEALNAEMEQQAPQVDKAREDLIAFGSCAIPV